MQLDFGPILSSAVAVAVKVAAVLIIFFIGRWLADLSAKFVRRTLDGRDTDEAVARMLATLSRLAVLGLAIVIAMGTLGIETTALAALVAAFGLAIGLALQGALGNFAGGVLILTFRPFGIGDLVEIGGDFGVVEDIQLVATVLAAPDGSTVIIPNGQVSNSTITNYSTTGVRRIDLLFGIGYDDDLQKAKAVLTDIVAADERILKDPAPTIRVSELGDSSVNITVWPFVKIEDYWDVRFDLTEQAKLRFDAEGLSIPYPQQDVHLIQAK